MARLKMHKPNQLLLMLIEVMGEEADPDDEPARYMDGTPAR